VAGHGAGRRLWVWSERHGPTESSARRSEKAVGEVEREVVIGEAIGSLPLLEAKVSVLIVDDHPSFRAVAKMVLETDGFAVVGTASDGESGVAATLRLAPDVVLLDVELPDIDGFEVAARLRRAGSATAIVLASTRDGADFGSLVAESGARGFVTKAELTGDAIRALVA
jgi:CheY-like chemotaxis protein